MRKKKKTPTCPSIGHDMVGLSKSGLAFWEGLMREQQLGYAFHYADHSHTQQEQ